VTETPIVPDPVVTTETRGFWDGAAVGEVRLARCTACGAYAICEQTCVACGGHERTWVPVSGAGTVKSFVVFHRGYHGYWATKVPYNVAVIALAEGPELLTNVIDVPVTELAVGQAVTIGFIDRGGHRAPVARLVAD
jgi:uncharacterized OB-fold protein